MTKHQIYLLMFFLRNFLAFLLKLNCYFFLYFDPQTNIWFEKTKKAAISVFSHQHLDFGQSNEKDTKNLNFQLNFDDPFSLIERANCLNKLQRFESALADANRAIKLQRKPNAKSLYVKGDGLYNLGDFEHALMFYNRSQKRYQNCIIFSVLNCSPHVFTKIELSILTNCLNSLFFTKAIALVE